MAERRRGVKELLIIFWILLISQHFLLTNQYGIQSCGKDSIDASPARAKIADQTIVPRTPSNC